MSDFMDKIDRCSKIIQELCECTDRKTVYDKVHEYLDLYGSWVAVAPWFHESKFAKAIADSRAAEVRSLEASGLVPIAKIAPPNISLYFETSVPAYSHIAVSLQSGRVRHVPVVVRYQRMDSSTYSNYAPPGVPPSDQMILFLECTLSAYDKPPVASTVYCSGEHLYLVRNNSVKSYGLCDPASLDLVCNDFQDEVLKFFKMGNYATTY